MVNSIVCVENSRGIENINSASFYHTEPLYNKDQGFFINTVIELDTILKPFELLDLIKKISSMLWVL